MGCHDRSDDWLLGIIEECDLAGQSPGRSERLDICVGPRLPTPDCYVASPASMAAQQDRHAVGTLTVQTSDQTWILGVHARSDRLAQHELLRVHQPSELQVELCTTGFIGGSELGLRVFVQVVVLHAVKTMQGLCEWHVKCEWRVNNTWL